MNTNTDSKLQEQISHTTDSAPYSVHYTRVPADTVPALYLHWHNDWRHIFRIISLPYTTILGIFKKISDTVSHL